MHKIQKGKLSPRRKEDGCGGCRNANAIEEIANNPSRFDRKEQDQKNVDTAKMKGKIFGDIQVKSKKPDHLPDFIHQDKADHGPSHNIFLLPVQLPI